jgi:hypothetical protein
MNESVVNAMPRSISQIANELCALYQEQFDALQLGRLADLPGTELERYRERSRRIAELRAEVEEPGPAFITRVLMRRLGLENSRRRSSEVRRCFERAYTGIVTFHISPPRSLGRRFLAKTGDSSGMEPERLVVLTFILPDATAEDTLLLGGVFLVGKVERSLDAYGEDEQ